MELMTGPPLLLPRLPDLFTVGAEARLPKWETLAWRLSGLPSRRANCPEPRSSYFWLDKSQNRSSSRKSLLLPEPLGRMASLVSVGQACLSLRGGRGGGIYIQPLEGGRLRFKDQDCSLSSGDYGEGLFPERSPLLNNGLIRSLIEAAKVDRPVKKKGPSVGKGDAPYYDVASIFSFWSQQAEQLPLYMLRKKVACLLTMTFSEGSRLGVLH